MDSTKLEIEMLRRGVTRASLMKKFKLSKSAITRGISGDREELHGRIVEYVKSRPVKLNRRAAA